MANKFDENVYVKNIESINSTGPLTLIEMENDYALDSADWDILEKFKLSPRQKECMYLRYWRHNDNKPLSHHEITLYLGICRRSIRTHLKRATRKIKKMTYKRVFIAGPYSANDIITVLNNMRVGMRESTRLMLAGFSPFCPFLDYQFQLMLRENEKLTIKHYYDYSIAWLEVSDAVVVLKGWKNSSGTLAELKRAKELNIPIYYSVDDFLNR